MTNHLNRPQPTAIPTESRSAQPGNVYAQPMFQGWGPKF